MPGPELPRRPLARQPEDQPEPVPWHAFTVGADVTEAYGQPSPALRARAERGCQRLGALHARLGQAGEDNTTEDGPA
ncbi:hypothetical protein OOK31_36485 [Streptomyces sp. NBC_00249]|uniref:hypothetical protein n=1 Tax=Streptomyces sp. NBC_00249 TaxID=2975690 RepID=UPI002259416F|nr:hypothetical protein [Streptomyces sp. NBC_00249]MCX5199312.1 hypothetical protein [Streptomyces sp. NBC_00249]